MKTISPASKEQYEDYLFPTDIENAVLNKHVYLIPVAFHWETGNEAMLLLFVTKQIANINYFFGLWIL